jgi:hypothetical protein
MAVAILVSFTMELKEPPVLPWVDLNMSRRQTKRLTMTPVESKFPSPRVDSAAAVFLLRRNV